MAKLYFRYGAMNSGKSTALLQVAYNYEERGQRVLLAKPDIDTKGAKHIISRLGVKREVDFLIKPGDDARMLFTEYAQGREPGTLPLPGETLPTVAALLVDEAQFLTSSQVDDLMRIAVLDGIPVLAYGLRADFRTRGFPGGTRLLEIAHSLEELKTICRCGHKAVFNARKVGDRFIFAGDQVSIDGQGVAYESLCGKCYLQESGGKLAEE